MKEEGVFCELKGQEEQQELFQQILRNYFLANELSKIPIYLT